jgi:phosphinothricin acetyltransferase
LYREHPNAAAGFQVAAAMLCNMERTIVTSSPINITPMSELHWLTVRDIYAQGIGTRNATFETELPEWAKWDARHLASCRLIALRDDEVVGWAALSGVSARHVYCGVAEVSVYVAAEAQGQGIGAALLATLIAESERNGIWTLQAGILAENTVSIHLHEKAGFRIVGRRERIGQLNGQWRDTVLMERRSQVVGG